ncbi:MAG: hydrogenase iron-sulfur subunit [Thermoleophilia bacterium]
MMAGERSDATTATEATDAPEATVTPEATPIAAGTDATPASAAASADATPAASAAPLGDDPRVGVFVCDCGTNIAATVDCPSVTEYAAGLGDVVFAEEGKWICSVDYLTRIQEAVKENDLNRAVVACCTPRTHEKLFKNTVGAAGMNPYQLEFVSIREQVSWVHKADKAIATEKAKDLVKMGVAKARLLEEGEEIRLPVKTDCLVIGGGAAGMTAALAVADQGYVVRLVETQDGLGGLLKGVNTVAPEGVSAAEVVGRLVDQVTANENIEVLTGTVITELAGYIGNYTVTVDRAGVPGTFDASTIIVATGMRELDATGHYGYGTGDDIVTQLELEGRLKSGEPLGAKDVVIVQCVRSRNEERGCCHIGCTVALKNALEIKERDPEANVYLLYKDLITVKDEYAHMKEILAAGVKTVRFSDAHLPEVTRGADGRALVLVHDVLLGAELTLPADLVVLTVGFEGDESVQHLRGLLKVSANDDGFFTESHIKLGPLDFAAAGVYLAGSARSPKPLRDVREEALGAAMRASIPMTKGFVEAEGIVATVDLTNCSQCGLCWKNCPFGAIKEVDKNPLILEALCKGCGLCAADCPKECIQIVHYGDDQIAAQIEAALEEKPEEKIIAFVCHWCALGAVDIAGVGRSEYPANARIIRVMCSARVAQKYVIDCMDRGAAGVLVAGCEFPTCHYITGNYKCSDRLVRLRKKMEKKGYDTSKLWEVWLSASMGPKWVATMKEMTEALGLVPAGKS